MSDFYNSVFNALSGEDFEERPVEVEEFVTSEEFLGLPQLSHYQYQMVRAGSQIYKRSTLVSLYGEKRGAARYAQTCSECIYVCGKGNIPGYQKVYSPEFGYVRADSLVDKAWFADARHRVHAASAFYEEGEDDVFKIVTKNGYEFFAGPNHKMPVWKNTRHGKNYTMSKEQMDLPLTVIAKDDILELKVGWSEPDIENQYPVSSEEARLIGYMIGDGSFARWDRRGGASNVKNPAFTNNTLEVQEDFTNIVHKMGGTLTEMKSGKGCWQVRVCGLNSWFIKHGLVQHYNEEKPWNDEWLSMSNINITELVKGVWATDGWFSFSQPRQVWDRPETTIKSSVVAAVEMTTKSCVQGLHLALLKVGVVSKFGLHRKDGNNGKHKATYRLSLHNGATVQQLVKLFSDVPGKQNAVNKILDMSLEQSKTNMHGDRVARIEYIGRSMTYGTMVDVESYFHGGGILSCNSGKDFISTIVCAYVVYLLLCLKDPQKYYGKPDGNSIDILNVATNSDQAKNVFFKNLKTIIKNCPWFDGRYGPPTTNVISFDKSINLYSGHSERESFEGLNLFLAVLDEISAFADTESESPEDTYNTYRDSVDSRFPDGFGKVLLLSFPRKKEGDFILDKYNEVIVEKEVVVRTETLKLDPDMPNGTEGNEFDVSWEEDHISRYKYPMIFALKRPSWEVNPTKNIGMYTRNFHSNMANALAKFACMPTEGGENVFFKNPDILDSIFVKQNLVDQNGLFLPEAVGSRDNQYYIHVDLSKVHDRCAVAVAHVEDWIGIQISPSLREVHPKVVIDMVRYWEPSKEEPMDYNEVVNFILSVRRRGFNIVGCTLDRWNSHDTINFLNSVGISTEMFSVKDDHYHTLSTLIYDQRLVGPRVAKLVTELKQLQYIKEKVDHPRSGYKDLSDAITGAVNRAIMKTPRPHDSEVEIYTYADLLRRQQMENPNPMGPLGVIKAPERKHPMPSELEDYLSSLRML